MAVAIVLIVLAYWLPSIVAGARKKAHGGGVIVVNLFFGWTLVGWVIALAMALSGPTLHTVYVDDINVTPYGGRLARQDECEYYDADDNYSETDLTFPDSGTFR